MGVFNLVLLLVIGQWWYSGDEQLCFRYYFCQGGAKLVRVLSVEVIRVFENFDRFFD